MPASEQELGWARAIKAAALAKGLRPVPDLMYLQMAVISKAKVKKAVRRLEKLQEFRMKYNISDPETDDAIALLRNSYALFPGFLGAVGRDTEGRGIQVTHVARYVPGDLKPGEWRTMLAAGYYMFHAFNSDVEGIRKGIRMVTDCRGMGWKNFSLAAQKKNAEIFQDAYPVRIGMYMCDRGTLMTNPTFEGTMYLLDPPGIMAIMLRLLRPILSKKMKEVIKVDETESFFKSGTLPPELVPKWFGGEANDNAAFVFLEEELKKRVENEKSFVL